MNPFTLVRRYLPRALSPTTRSDMESARETAARADAQAAARTTALLPADATIGRLRQFSIHHDLRPSHGLVGEHRSRRRGSAPEFSDFSPYTPGDDVRRIDWNAYARLDTLIVRESEITTELDVHLLLDATASMAWSGAAGRETKLEMARRVTMTLAWIALSRSDRVTLAGVANRLSEPYGPLQGRGMVVAAAQWLAGLTGNGAGSIADAMRDHATQRPRAGLVIVVSDFVGVTPDELNAALTSLANRRWRVALLRVEDPAEADPSRLEASQEVFELHDPEGDTRQRVNLHPDTLRQYRQARGAWLEGLEVTARRHLMPLVTIDTGARLDPDVLQSLEQQRVIVA